MTTTCEGIFDEFLYYTKHISPVYSYLVALKAQKPLQVLIELENTFAHMAQASQDIAAEKNIERAHNHLLRLETDLYKLLLVELMADLKEKNKMSGKFVSLSRNARETELNSIGSDGHNEVIEAYYQAVNTALSSLGLEELQISFSV